MQDYSAKQAAKLVYETALLESGFMLEDPKDFATRLYSVIKTNLKVSSDATLEVDEEVQETKDRHVAAHDIPEKIDNQRSLNDDQVTRYSSVGWCIDFESRTICQLLTGICTPC